MGECGRPVPPGIEWELAQIPDGHVIHVAEHLVLAHHAPDEGVGLGADAGMDGPARGDHRLLVVDQQVTGLVRLTHHVEHGGIVLHVEVEVDLHAALVGVAGHGVPQAALFQLGHAHHQLAGRQHVRHQVLVDGATVAGGRIPKGGGGGLGLGDSAGREVHMGRGAVVVELGRLPGIDAGEAQLAGTHADVQRLGMADLVFAAIHDDQARSADIDEAELAALEEVADAEGLAQLGREGEGAMDRHDATEHDAIDVAVGHGQAIGTEDLLHQKLTAQPLSVQLFGMIAVDTLTNLHG